MKKAIGISLAFLALTAVLLAGCAGAQLAKGFDKNTVTEKAKQTVDVINTLDYDAVSKLMRADLQAQVPADKLKEAWDKQLTGLGTFDKYDGVTVYGQNSGGLDYAVAVVTAKYKNGTAIYTISFDKDMQLAGLYMK